MALSTNEEIRRIFELATMRREAEAIKTSHQWRKARSLVDRCWSARFREKKLYAERYQTRVEVRRLQLVNEAGAIGRDFQPAWGGGDKFSPEATKRQAERDVRAAHERRMQRIAQFEHGGLTGIMEECRHLDPHTGLAVDAFSRATDRRDGIDRRVIDFSEWKRPPRDR